MSTITPLTPEEVMNKRGREIPSVVITAVNNLLTKNFTGGSVSIKQDSVIEEIMRLDSNITRAQINDNKWLDFEPIFRSYGWEVDYDKPSFNETYDSIFKFKPKLNVVK